MSNTVKKCFIEYYPLNKWNIFTSGDCLTGQVTLELEKQCKIDSLCIKFKGKAEAQWNKKYGQIEVKYYSNEKYFTIKQFLIEDTKGNNVVGPGQHVYPFTFQIPALKLPSSFFNSKGKIQYRLETILSRSMRLDIKAKLPIILVHKRNLNNYPSLLVPQSSITDKKLKFFASGTVAMDVNIPQTGYYQGEGIKVVASIQNKSSRDIKPKYCLYGKYTFFADGEKLVKTEDILKEVGEVIPPSSSQTVTRIITIPPTKWISIFNCDIINVRYGLRVYLDVKYASDPEVNFPIVILPAYPRPDGEQLPAYAT